MDPSPASRRFLPVPFAIVSTLTPLAGLRLFQQRGGLFPSDPRMKVSAKVSGTPEPPRNPER